MELSAKFLLNVVSALAWCWLYIWVTVKWPRKSPEFASRVVTFLHGSVAAVSGMWLCGFPEAESCFVAPRNPVVYCMMVWSWGYFAFDFLWCLVYWTKNLTMLFHHVCSLVAITAYMDKKNTGCIYPCTVALMEITNPMLQTRWFLRDAGYSSTMLYKMVEVTYLLSFIILRVFVGTYLVFKIVQSNTFGAEDKLLTFLLYAVSLIFVYEIIGYVLYKYKGKIEEYRTSHIEVHFTSDNANATEQSPILTNL